MANEILAIPEDNLEEVIIVIRTGLANRDTSKEVSEQLTKWCNEEEKYLSNR